MPPKPPEEFLSGTTTVYETGTIESSTTTPIYSSPKRTHSKRRTTNSSTSPYKALFDSTTPPQLHNEHNSNNTVNFVVNNDNNNINGVSSSILTNNLTTLTLSNNDSSSSNSSRVETEYVISPYQKKLAPSTRRRSLSKQDPSSFYSLPPTITPIPTINAKSSNIIDSGHYNLNLKSIDIGSNDGTTTIRPRQQSKDSGTPKVVSDNNIISYIKSILSYINLEIIKFIVLCLLWYASSAITNNIGKQILNQFNYPLTLTWIQFGFVAFYCYLFGNGVGFTKLEPPSHQILIKTLPLSLFSIIGHVFSSYATSRVPVSFVHTIKALSPLFTVFFYRFGFKVNYSSRVYTSLLPLTIGVMLACSSSTTSNFIGFLFALGSTVIFVAQNIFSKNILFNQNNSIGLKNLKLDELNVSFYSSLLAFILMYPIWLYYEGSTLIFNHWWIDSSISSSSLSSSNSWIIVFYFWLNGSSHFAQNILALSILSITSPVTYSIASLVKRIFVITASIIWFGQKTSFIQGIGITLTFWGLYMYNQAKKDVERKERKATEDEIILPITSKTR